MRSHAKAPSAASTSTEKKNGRLLAGLGLAFLLCALTLSVVGSAQATKLSYFSFGSSGTLGGQFSSTVGVGGIAVNNNGAGGANAGDVYAVDRGNNRIERFSANGTFISAWGFDVIQSGKPGDLGASSFEVCTVASDCKAGIASVSPAPGGELSTPQGIAVNQQSGDVYVTDQGFIRVQEFSATGAFIRAWGQDVVSSGPGNTGTGAEICVAANGDVCKEGTSGTGVGAFGSITAPAAPFSGYLAVAPVGAPNAGNVLVADPINHRVQEFSPSGAFVRTFGGGVLNNGGAEGTGTATNGSATVSAVSTTKKAFLVGQTITGTGIEPGTKIITVGATTLTLSQPAGPAATGAPTALSVAEGAGNSPVNEKQTFTINPAVTAGNVKLEFIAPNPQSVTAAQTTANIPFNATPAQVQSALVALTNIGAGNVSVSLNPGGDPGGGAKPGGPWTIEFAGTRYSDTNVPQLKRKNGTAPNLNVTPAGTSAIVATAQDGAADAQVCEVAAECLPGGVGSGAGLFGEGKLNSEGSLLEGTPTRVAEDQTGAIYTVESAASFRAQKFTPHVGPPTLTPAIFGGAGAPNGSSSENTPTDVAIAPGGNVLVAKGFAAGATPSCPKGNASVAESRVQELSPSGATLTDTHMGCAGVSAVNGIAIDSSAAHLTSGRLYVSSGAEAGEQRVFVFADPPPHPPTVATGANAPGADEHLRTLEGTLNPAEFKVTECYFEYGPTTAYGTKTPCVPSAASLGEGTSDIPVSASTEPLEPNTTYHYRLLAANVGQSAKGEDRTFATGPAPADSCPNAARRAEQGIDALLLPDCMALEMASPAEKTSQLAYLENLRSEVSPDGKRLLFRTAAQVPGSPGSLGLTGDIYVATRGGAGWSSASTSPPSGSAMVRGWKPFAEAKSFTPDLSRWLQVAATEAQYQVGKGRAFEGGLDGSFTPLSPLLEPVGGGIQQDLQEIQFQGASTDHSHLFFTPGRQQTSYLPGDPTLSGGVFNIYVAHPDESEAPSLELLARDRNGKIWGGACGTTVGGKPSGLFAWNQGAISDDGKRTYFTTRPGQAASGECDSANNKLRVMVRLESSQGAHIEELFSPECYRANCSTANGDDFYQGASQDGSKVFFATNRQLTTSDTDTGSACSATIGSSAGCDLYLYDSSLSAGHRLIQVSAGEAGSPTPGEGAEVLNGTVGISADGSHVYFVATGVLTTANGPGGSPPSPGQPNLYLYERDSAHPSGHIAFVGQLNGGDTPGLWGGEGTWRNQAYPVPILDEGGDGHILLFQTKAALAANDTDGARLDEYRYEAGDETLACLSCRPGGPDGEPLDVEIARKLLIDVSGTDFAEQGRWASEDGEAVVFKTAEALLPGDVNGVTDSYLWREGKLYRLPGTGDVTGKLNDEPILSTEGTTVAFQTFAPLLPEDIDDATDVYVGIVDGGFPSKAATQTCDPSQASACQGAAPTSPPAPNSASTNPSAGNPLPKPTACPKGSRKVRRNGKARCVKAHHRIKRRNRQHRRDANANRRAGK